MLRTITFTSWWKNFDNLRACRCYITRTNDAVFLNVLRYIWISYEFGDKNLLEIGSRAADVVLAYVAVVEIAHIRILQDALQTLYRKIRQLLDGSQFVQVVHRVTGPDPLSLQLIGLYAGFGIGQSRVADALLALLPILPGAVLYDTRRERSHADLYFPAGTLRGQ